MNKNIEKLYKIAAKEERNIIGLMSGTSFDGLDIALCQFKGYGPETQVKVLHFVTKDYDAAFKEDLKSVFAKKMVDLEKITLLNAYIGSYYASLVSACLKEWQLEADDIDIIASHGQTIFHAPKHMHGNQKYGNATLQIGDADHLAVNTGIITISDFRQKHIAGGGEGAPLAVYGDYLIFSHPKENRIMLNIGGIANFTYLPANFSESGFSTDVGPGNTLMDQYIQLKFPGRYYDKDATIASAGKINEGLLKALLDNDFFRAPFPKTTGPELFSLAYLNRAIERSEQQGLNDYDIMATLVQFSAEGIAQAIISSIKKGENYTLYLSGGGMYNPLLVDQIERLLNKKTRTTKELGINPDAKEAVLFALLANEAVAGRQTHFERMGGLPAVSMGKVSFPY
ncbi:anhydro-N-acetylmuramic acid kinase [Olivibacter jilunii]|uniref:anhydro-N-acetylmuramic acid kinase n=1 Tax=Olivibacter jilunii TaxID=985016 RepID=UPI003F1589A6